MPALLDHADPRLGLRAARAAPNDPMTRAAIRLLGDTLAESGDGVLSGPAVGLPVQIIALRQGDLTGYYLNPTIVLLGPLALSHAETSQHTGPIRRNTPRAKKLTFRGTDLSGVAQQADLSGELALRAQQAFDLLDSPAPLGWLSAFHRALLNERDAPRRQLFEAVNVGLYSTPPYDGSRPETASGLRFSAPNIVAVHPDAPGAALTHIAAPHRTQKPCITQLDGGTINGKTSAVFGPKPIGSNRRNPVDHTGNEGIFDNPA